MSDYGYFRIIGMSNDEVRQWLKISKIKRCHKQRHGLYHYEQSMGLPVNESESVGATSAEYYRKRRRRNAMNPARIEEIISAMTGRCEWDEYYDKIDLQYIFHLFRHW